MGGKPEVMQVSDVYHIGETQEHGYAADKPTNIYGAKQASNPYQSHFTFDSPYNSE